MNYPLAIATPNVGGLSETFIRKHIEELLPGKTATVAYDLEEYWRPSGPMIAANHLHKSVFKYPGSGFRQLFFYTAMRLFDFQKPDIDTSSAVENFIKSNGVEVILGEYLSFSFDFFLIAKRNRIPYFAHAHGVDISYHINQRSWQEKYCQYKDAAGIIAMSEYSRQQLMEFGFQDSLIHVIPYGVDIPSEPVKRETFNYPVRCLAVGRFVPKKSPLLLLEAFRLASLSFPDMKLNFIGDGPLLKAAAEFVREHDLNHCVSLYGKQPSEIVFSLMRESDIFIQHSVVDPETGDSEGLPVAILEAMAAALPVVSTRHAGIPEAVIEESTGFLVNERDYNAMADYLVCLARDPQLRATMGQKGWERAKTEFSWEKERRDLLRLMGLAA